ncbi:hypothetical protein CDV26_06490 [Francisella halioticida]|uniref:Uncharacterized protein n=1 Tax=Francisella halioticida TaxID=549298 RepID=A0ABM6LZU1_9GAMM|nr:hypothetical protein [Francisella halioticida]ASG68080.1 hypothetical protein CDV26_06490 [Francisella halioticida]
MSVTKDSHQQSSGVRNTIVEKNRTKDKSSRTIISKFSLVVSLVAMGMAGYVTVNSIVRSKSTNNETYQYTILQKQLTRIKQAQSDQMTILDDVSSQKDSQQNSIKAIQSQLSIVNSQLAAPTKDLYMQMGITNIQSAIDYLILAKDVVTFSGDVQRANDLVDIAFDKIEASKVANISAIDRQNIKNTLKRYASREDVIKEFINIEQQFGKLKYITPENVGSVKTKQSENKYMKLLNSIVKIQDIPKNQILVSTKQAKQFISDNLYQLLISLQTAMYTNNKADITLDKTSLINILEKYFVQDSNAKNLEKTIQSIQSRETEDLDNTLDKVINQLSSQQNDLLTKESVLNASSSKKGSNK